MFASARTGNRSRTRSANSAAKLSLHAFPRCLAAARGARATIDGLEPHFLDLLGLAELSVGGFNHICDRNTRRGLEQRGATTRKADDGELGDNEVHAPHRSQWQGTFLDDLR